MNRERILEKFLSLEIFKVFSSNNGLSKISLLKPNNNGFIDRNSINFAIFLIDFYYEAVSVIALKNQVYDEKKQKKLVTFQTYVKKVINFCFDCLEQNSKVYKNFHSLIKLIGTQDNLVIDENNFEQNIDGIIDELVKSVLEISKFFVFDNEMARSIETKYINLLDNIKGVNDAWIPNLCFALCEYKKGCFYYAVSGIENEQNYFKLNQKKDIIHKRYYDLICSLIEELLGFDKIISSLDKCVLTKQSLLYTTDYCKENEGEVFLLPHPVTLNFLTEFIGCRKIRPRKFSCSERKIVDRLLQDNDLLSDIILANFDSTKKINLLKDVKFYIRFAPCNLCKPALYGCNSIFFLNKNTFRVDKVSFDDKSLFHMSK